MNPSQLIRGLFALGSAQLITWVAGMVTAVMLPRYLGDVNLGKLAFAQTLTTLLGLAADLGINPYLAKEIARDPERAKVLTGNALAMRFPLTMLAAAICIGVVQIAGQGELTRDAVYVFAGGILLSSLGTVLLGTLSGFQRMKDVAMGSIAMKVGFAILSTIVLLLGAGTIEVAFAWVTASVLSLVVYGRAVSRRTRLTLHFDWALWRAILLGGLPFFVWQSAFVIYAQIDMVLLSFFSDDAVIGWYAAAQRIIFLPVFVPAIVSAVIYPALSAAVKDPSSFNALARRAMHAVILLSLPMGLGIMLLPDKIIQFFGYPATFTNSIVLIVLMAPHIPLVGIDMMIGTVLNTRDRQRYWAFAAMAAAVLNPLINLAAIPITQNMFGNGAIGASAITTLTEVFLLVVGLILLPKGIFNRTTYAAACKCLIAGVLMGIVVWTLRDLALVATIAIGATVYSAASLALGLVSIGELQQLRSYLVRRRSAAPASA